MEIVKVGLCLDDRDYAEKLAEGLSREYKGLQIYLLDDLKGISGLDLILASRWNGQSNVVEAGCDMQEEQLESEPYRLCIYKDCPNMINDLLYIYFKLTGKVCRYIGENICRTVAFCSTSGSCEVTRTAVETGKYLYRVFGSRCLYINLCLVDESHDILHHEEGSLLKLLYYISNSVDFPVGRFISEGTEIDCLKTGVINSYSDEMTPEIFEKLLVRIEEQGIYDFVLLDIGNQFSRTNRRLIAEMDHIILMEKNTGNRLSESVRHELKRLRGEKPFMFLSCDHDGYYGKHIADISKKIVEDCEFEVVRQGLHTDKN
ncbi:MAG: hypothetical protein ACI4LC_07355 [Emergencia sp.]